jgi:hypothetical protein
MPEYDSPWKEVVDQQTRLAFGFLFPLVEQDTDWSEEVDSLDHELRKMAPAGPTGRRLADKLLKVKSLSGDDRYLHFEVQAQPQGGFERRVYVYHYRGDDRFGLPVESLVVLADEDPGWRPTTYSVQLKYTRLTFEFKPVKLLDWAGRREELASHPNPMGLFVLAHLEAQRTRQDVEERAAAKLGLILKLLERKLDGEEMRHWYKYLDWFLDLPPELERQVWAKVGRHEQEGKMPFVTFAERYGEEKGLRKGELKGLLAGLEAILEVKFKEEGLALMPALRQVEEPATLEAILNEARKAVSLEDVRRHLPNGGPAGNGAAP